MNATKKAIGKFVSAKRNSIQLSQEQLAKRADISRAAVSNIENNEVNLSIETLEGILNALGSDWMEFAEFLTKSSSIEESIEKYDVSEIDADIIKSL